MISIVYCIVILVEWLQKIDWVHCYVYNSFEKLHWWWCRHGPQFFICLIFYSNSCIWIGTKQFTGDMLIRKKKSIANKYWFILLVAFVFLNYITVRRYMPSIRLIVQHQDNKRIQNTVYHWRAYVRILYNLLYYPNLIAWKKYL